MISRRAEGPDRKRFRFALGNENAQSYLLVSTPRPCGPGTGKRRLYGNLDASQWPTIHASKQYGVQRGSTR